MIFVLDTTAFSDLMNLRPATQMRARTLAPDDRVAISSIVRGEVLFGIERLPMGRRRTALKERANELFALFDVEDVSLADAEHYAGTKRACELRGVVVAENDMWIAATAIRLSGVLVTRDRDQLRINEVTSEDWSVWTLAIFGAVIRGVLGSSGELTPTRGQYLDFRFLKTPYFLGIFERQKWLNPTSV